MASTGRDAGAVEPTAFPSGPHVYLMYELHLTNFMPMPVSLSRIDVIDADAETSQPIQPLKRCNWKPCCSL